MSQENETQNVHNHNTVTQEMKKGIPEKLHTSDSNNTRNDTDRGRRQNSEEDKIQTATCR